MKHLSKILAFSALALFAAVGCQKQFNEDLVEFAPAGDFTIQISTTPMTKTASDPTGSITFSVGDKVNLFHTPHNYNRAYAQYENDGCFTVTEINEGTATLMGELSEDLRSDATYDWFAVYPYNSETTSPENAVVNFKTSISCGSEPTSALAGEACPLAGEAMNVKGGITPVLSMRQIASIIAIKVMNTTEDDIVVNNIEIGSFTNALAGKHSFKTQMFDRIVTDPVEMAWLVDEEFEIEQWGKRMSSPRFEQTVIEPEYKVSLSVGGVTLEPYEPVTFYVPVAPTIFMTLGENFTIKVNDIYKQATMWPHRLMYIPWEEPSDFRYIRHKFLSGKIHQFSFEYSFTDVENEPCEWVAHSKEKSDGSLTQDVQPSCFSNSKDIVTFMGVSSNVKADANMSNGSLASMWLQSYGTAFFAPFNMGTLHYLMENEGPVFSIPAKHISAGSKVVLETLIDVNSEGPADKDDTNGNPEDLHTQGGGAFYMCDYSLDQGKSWTPAAITSDIKYDGPVNANICFPMASVSGDNHIYPFKAECPVTSEFSEKTFLLRIKCVNSAFNVADVVNGRASGSRTPYVTDLQNQPGMHGGIFRFRIPDGEKFGTFAKISIQ